MFKFVLLCFGCIIVSAQRNKRCSTPNLQTGQCIVLQQCSELYNMALNVQDLSQREVTFLRDSACGWDGDRPKVCCPVSSPPSPPTQGNTGNNLLPDLQNCGLHEANRIVGGERTGLKEFPWMVLLQYNTPEGGGFKCGGALISNRYVLTAAHCIKRIPRTWTLISVRVGEHDLAKDRDCDDERPGFEDCADPPEDIPVEQAIAHSQYKTGTVFEQNDIALIRLRREVHLSKYVFPICLPPVNYLNQRYAGTQMTVAGWGRTENTSFSNVKLKLDVPIEANDVCFPKYKDKGAQLWEKQFCAGGLEGQDSCKGDSGGPLMHSQLSGLNNWFVTGIVSFGPRKCGTKGFPGVYTRVADYRDWIISNIRA